MDENDKQFFEALFVKQKEQFQQFIDIVTENFDHKLAIVAEGHQMLSEKLERVEFNLGSKLDKLAAEVTAHRADAEAHHGLYRIKKR